LAFALAALAPALPRHVDAMKVNISAEGKSSVGAKNNTRWN
jgi:hypothetical protein